MGDELQRVELDAAQAASVLLDREPTVERACAMIREAGANGAEFIGLPVGFTPAFTEIPLATHGRSILSGHSQTNSGPFKYVRFTSDTGSYP